MYTADLIIYACINNEMDRIKFQNKLYIFYSWCIKWELVIDLQRVNLSILDIIIINNNIA